MIFCHTKYYWLYKCTWNRCFLFWIMQCIIHSAQCPSLKAVCMLKQALIYSAQPFQDLQNTSDKKTSEGRLMGWSGGKKELFALVALAPSLVSRTDALELEVSRSDALRGFASAASCHALLLGGCPRLSQPPGFLSALQGRLILVHRTHHSRKNVKQNSLSFAICCWLNNQHFPFIHFPALGWITPFLWPFQNQPTSVWM